MGEREDPSGGVVQAWVQAGASASAWVGSDGRYRCANDTLANLLDAPAASWLEGRSRTEVLTTRLVPRLAEPTALVAYLTEADRNPVATTHLTLVETACGRVLAYESAALPPSLGGWRETIVAVDVGSLSDLAGELRRAAAERAAKHDELTARISHELRTPLSAVIGFCHMLLSYSGELQPRQAEYVQKILRNASILLQLLNNALDLARINSGPMPLLVENVELAALIADAVESVEPQTWEKGLPIRVAVDPETPDLVTDRLKLKQVVTNLLSNAVKYTEQGEVVISAGPTDGGALITVADTGIGIPADQLERIFEPYVQVAETRPRRAGGTGLGLAICDRLTALLGGTIAVESELGKGSTFTLRLPLKAPESPPPGSA